MSLVGPMPPPQVPDADHCHTNEKHFLGFQTNWNPIYCLSSLLWKFTQRTNPPVVLLIRLRLFSPARTKCHSNLVRHRRGQTITSIFNKRQYWGLTFKKDKTLVEETTPRSTLIQCLRRSSPACQYKNGRKHKRRYMA